jgi:hypothetical protein
MKKFLFVSLILASELCFLSDSAVAQETETLMNADTKFNSMWSLELKTNSLQKEIGSLIGIYWGAVINRSIIFGIGGASNLTHKVTNYGYFQLSAQYVEQPDKLLHYGGQIIFGLATAKDYQSPKSGLFDNFANTSGTGFYFVEPRINAELNITQSEKLVLGLSYCFALGLEEKNQNVAKSKITNKDLSGVTITIGVKFGEY